MTTTGFKTDVGINLQNEFSLGDLNILVVGESTRPTDTPVKISSRDILKSNFNPSNSDVYPLVEKALNVIEYKLPSAGGVNVYAHALDVDGSATARSLDIEVGIKTLAKGGGSITVEFNDLSIETKVIAGDTVDTIISRMSDDAKKQLDIYYSIVKKGTDILTISILFKSETTNDAHFDVKSDIVGLIKSITNTPAVGSGDISTLLPVLENTVNFDYIIVPQSLLTQDFIDDYNELYNRRDNKTVNGFIVSAITDTAINLVKDDTHLYNSQTFVPVWFELKDEARKLTYFNQSPQTLSLIIAIQDLLLRTKGATIDFFPSNLLTNGLGSAQYNNHDLSGMLLTQTKSQPVDFIGYTLKANELEGIINTKGGIILEINTIGNIVCGATFTSFVKNKDGSSSQHRSLSRWKQLFFIQKFTKKWLEGFAQSIITKGQTVDGTHQVSRLSFIRSFEREVVSVLQTGNQSDIYAIIHNNPDIKKQIVGYFEQRLDFDFKNGTITSSAVLDLVSPLREIFITISPFNN